MNIDIKKKAIITSLVLAAVIFALIFFTVKPIFSQIKKESLGFAIQKKELLEAEDRIKNINDFKTNFKQYQPNLEKIGELLTDASEPVEFIEFLEKEAGASSLSIEINPPIFREGKGDFWPSLDFNLEMIGSAQNFLKFLDRIESSPYLAETANLTLRKNPDKAGIIASLLIKVYAK